MDDETSVSSRNCLLSVFQKTPGTAERVGIEVECASLDPTTGTAVPYQGPHGLRALLEAVLRQKGGEPVSEGPVLTGVQLDGDGSVSLELGGAFEYSSPPMSDVVTLVERMRRELEGYAELARGLGFRLVPGGYLPFDTPEEVNWVPKPRAEIMRRHYRALGDAGSKAPAVMTLNISTQVTLDYVAEDDLARKLRMLVGVSPIAAALFANSPIEAGRFSGMLSRRTYNWTRADPPRCGVLPVALAPDMRLDDFVDWALELPMIFRRRPGGYEPAPRQAFRSLLDHGFDDGAKPTLADWRSHLCQIWTDVRLRDTIELRSTDGPSYQAIPAVPAFWTGLAYHPPALEQACELLEGRTLAEHRAAVQEISTSGLRARHGGVPVQELARELVRLAWTGIEARVRQGLEQPAALSYLEPVEDVAASGVTFAERLLRRWAGDLDGRADRYVAAYAI